MPILPTQRIIVSPNAPQTQTVSHEFAVSAGVGDGTRIVVTGGGSPQIGGITLLEQIGDVDITLRADNYYLQWDAGTSTYIFAAGGTAPSATTSVEGIIEIATDGEANAATATDRAITPSNLPSITTISGLTTVGVLQSPVIVTPEMDTITTAGSGDLHLNPGTGKVKITAASVADGLIGLSSGNIVYGQTAGASAFDDITDVSVAGVVDYSFLQFNSEWGNTIEPKWKAQSGVGVLTVRGADSASGNNIATWPDTTGYIGLLDSETTTASRFVTSTTSAGLLTFVDPQLTDLSDVSSASDAQNRVMATPDGSSGDYTGRAIVFGDFPSTISQNLFVIIEVSVTQIGQEGGVPSQVTIKLKLADGSYFSSEWDCRVTIFTNTIGFLVVSGTLGINPGDAQVVARGTTTALYDMDEAGNFGESGKQDYAWRSQADGEILLDINGFADTYGLRVGPTRWNTFSSSFIGVWPIIITAP